MTKGGKGSGFSGGGVIGNKKPIVVKNEKRQSSGNRWAYVTLEATADNNGVVTVGYPTAVSYEHPNRNTTEAYYELKAGFYNQPGSRTIQAHNIDLAKANIVRGSAGFRWDRQNNQWVK